MYICEKKIRIKKKQISYISIRMYLISYIVCNSIKILVSLMKYQDKYTEIIHKINHK